MKKIVSILLAACILTLCLTSCGSPAPSYELYEKNLGENYEVDSSTILVDIFELMYSIDADNYDIISARRASEKSNPENFAYIIKCESKESAEKLANKCYTLLKILSDASSLDTVSDGNFVLTGTKSVVKKALDK